MLKIIISDSTCKTQRQIKALECLIQKDGEKDRQIHSQILNDLKLAL